MALMEGARDVLQWYLQYEATPQGLAIREKVPWFGSSVANTLVKVE